MNWKCCKDCPDRHTACWGDCERYAEELRLYREQRNQLNKYREAYSFTRKSSARRKMEHERLVSES